MRGGYLRSYGDHRMPMNRGRPPRLPTFTPEAIEECRKQLGEDIELLHDIHERASPRQAVQFAVDVGALKLF